MDQELSVSNCNSLLLNRENRSKLKDEALKELGQFLKVSVKDNHRSQINISSFFHWVQPAILHDQFIFLSRDGDSDYCGYLMWAWVNDKTLNDYSLKDRFSIQPMNWNEGRNFIIVDLYLPEEVKDHAIIRNLYRRARNNAGLKVRDINFSIRDNQGIVIRPNRKAMK